MGQTRTLLSKVDHRTRNVVKCKNLDWAVDFS